MAVHAYSGSAPVAGSLITVNLAGTQVLATIYADPILTPLANPFTSDLLTGAYLFYAEVASYDVVVTTGLDQPSNRLPGLPEIVFSGTSPNRVASLVVEDPETHDQVVLAQVIS